MKLFPAFIFSIILLTGAISVKAQRKYFKTPNNFGNYKATLFLKNGKPEEGKLSFDVHKDAEHVTIDTDKGEHTYRVTEVAGFQKGDDYYAMESFDPWDSRIKYSNRFMKRLTDSSSRIHLYELDYFEEDWDGYQGKKGGIQVITRRSYFIRFSSFSATHALELFSKSLVNDFDTKLAPAFNDCSAVQEAIKTKKYFYKRSDKVKEAKEVWENIIKEYNSCK
jgi:hypothetical protein